jgi:putative tricarboxylic transport membrane protein|tara:strand:- start:1812 stop:2243 length:432 start_codon:yes stop_codon:yes gene_type:complete
MNDRVFGVFTLLLSIFYIFSAYIVEESFISDHIGPKIYPYLVSFFLIISSLFLIVKPDIKPHWPKFGKIIEILMTASILIMYAIFLPVIGFVFSTLFASSFISWRLGAKLTSAFTAGLIISVSIFILFRKVLGLSLATGPFGF